jgi:hypothetical protein
MSKKKRARFQRKKAEAKSAERAALAAEVIANKRVERRNKRSSIYATDRLTGNDLFR